jgi:hypothetical protein
MISWFRPQPLRIIAQAYKINQIYPDCTIFCRTKYDTFLRWKGILQPTPLSCKYTIKLVYKIGTRPNVYVLEPELVVPDKKSEIHMFNDGSLCLYFKDDWTPKMLIAETLIPWTSEWLLHYEVWRITGKWHGGGIHPEE